MTTDYERIKDAFLSGWAAADDTAWGREQAAQAYLDALPPASSGAGGDLCRDCTDLVGEPTPCIVPYDAPTPVEPRGCPTAGAVTERDRFEAYAKRQGYDTKRLNGGKGDYDQVAVHLAWSGWQWKARALAADAQQGE